MNERLARIELIKLETDRLQLEVRECNDLERLIAIGYELQVLLNSITEIRREQLREQIDRPSKRWWRRGR